MGAKFAPWRAFKSSRGIPRPHGKNAPRGNVRGLRAKQKRQAFQLDAFKSVRLVIRHAPDQHETFCILILFNTNHQRAVQHTVTEVKWLEVAMRQPH